MRNGESIDSKTLNIRIIRCKLCHPEPSYIPLGLTPLLLISIIKCIYQANLVCSILR